MARIFEEGFEPGDLPGINPKDGIKIEPRCIRCRGSIEEGHCLTASEDEHARYIGPHCLRCLPLTALPPQSWRHK